VGHDTWGIRMTGPYILNPGPAVEIPKNFWDPTQNWWKNTNNHALLMLRHVYLKFEKDPQFAWLNPIIDKLVYLYVTNPQYRQRIGWIFIFMDLYIRDRQFIKENGGVFGLEMSIDPRHWMSHMEEEANRPTIHDKSVENGVKEFQGMPVVKEEITPPDTPHP
jgi:hypothetical protein